MTETLHDIEAALTACDKAYDKLDRERFPVLAKALVKRQNALMIKRQAKRVGRKADACDPWKMP